MNKFYANNRNILDHDHNDRTYRIQVTESRWLIIKKSKHIKAAPNTEYQLCKDEKKWDILEDTLKNLKQQIPL